MDFLYLSVYSQLPSLNEKQNQLQIVPAKVTIDVEMMCKTRINIVQLYFSSISWIV